MKQIDKKHNNEAATLAEQIVELRAIITDNVETMAQVIAERDVAISELTEWQHLADLPAKYTADHIAEMTRDLAASGKEVAKLKADYGELSEESARNKRAAVYGCYCEEDSPAPDEGPGHFVACKRGQIEKERNTLVKERDKLAERVDEMVETWVDPVNHSRHVKAGVYMHGCAECVLSMEKDLGELRAACKNAEAFVDALVKLLKFVVSRHNEFASKTLCNCDFCQEAVKLTSGDGDDEN